MTSNPAPNEPIKLHLKVKKDQKEHLQRTKVSKELGKVENGCSKCASS